MPLLSDVYCPAWFMFSGHLETVWPVLVPRRLNLAFERHSLPTPDADFVDVDSLRAGHRRLLIITHGLEGSSQSQYVKGLAQLAFARGFDVAAWNFRGCSGRINNLPRYYHSGDVDDLRCVIEHFVNTQHYERIYLVGFSVGANITLKFLGQHSGGLANHIETAVGFCAPCDLAGAVEKMEHFSNKIYLEYFLRSLRKKIRHKSKLFPDAIDVTKLRHVKTFREFDDRYTAPLHGFRSASHYWSEASSQGDLDTITTPMLLIQASNDPLLPTSCHPVAQAKDHKYLYLMMTSAGGHCGYHQRGPHFWSEATAVRWLENQSPTELTNTYSESAGFAQRA